MLNEKEIVDFKNELRLESLEWLENRKNSLSSRKSRLKKMENKKDEMEKVIIEERIVSEVIIEKKEKKVYIYERLEDEIKVMNIEEVMKGLKNVSSLVSIENSKRKELINSEKLDKLEVVRIWLLERKDIVSGNSLGKVNISDILRKMEDISNLEELKEWLMNK